MMQFLRSTGLLYLAHLRLLVRSKRMILCVVLCLLPVGIAALAAGKEDAVIVAGRLTLLLHLLIILPIVSMIFGSTVVTEERESRTMTYPFTRPISRLAFFLGRWAATVTAVAVLVLGSAQALLYVVSNVGFTEDRGRASVKVEKLVGLDEDGAEDWKMYQRTERDDLLWIRYGPYDDWTREYVGDMRRGEVRPLVVKTKEDEALRLRCIRWEPYSQDIPAGFTANLMLASLLGVAAYSLFTAGLGIFLKRPIIVGLGYAFAIEAFLGSIPSNIQKIAVQFYLRAISFHGEDMKPALRGSPFAQVEMLTPGEASLRLGVVIVLLVAWSGWSIRKRQFTFTS